MIFQSTAFWLKIMEFLLSPSLRGRITFMLICLTATTFAQRKMVNLGGWLVAEKYLTPELFQGVNGETEFDLSSTVPKKLKEHHASFVTENDFQYLKDHSIQGVRIPVGWWIAQQPPPSPYVDGYLEALDNAFSWGQKHGIHIVVDLHAAPGAQNRDSHSGSKGGVCDWKNPENIAKTLKVIDFIAKRYATNKALLGIELLNEPRSECVSEDVLRQYYTDGYKVVRKHSTSAYVILCQLLGVDSYDAPKILPPGKTDRVVLDIHLYNVFGGCNSNTADGNIKCVNENRKPLVKFLNGRADVLVGEWANVWNGNVKDGLAMRKKYSQAQLAVYGEASFGWAYWTLKTDAAGYWSFQKNVADGLI